MSKKRYQDKIIIVRGLMSDGLVIKAYDILGKILEDMENE